MFMYSICQLPIAVTERARGPRCRADNGEEENSQGENRLGAETPEMAWMSRGALLADWDARAIVAFGKVAGGRIGTYYSTE